MCTIYCTPVIMLISVVRGAFVKIFYAIFGASEANEAPVRILSSAKDSIDLVAQSSKIYGGTCFS